MCCIIINVWDLSDESESIGVFASLEQGNLIWLIFCFCPCTRVTLYEDHDEDLELTFECQHINLEIQLTPNLNLITHEPFDEQEGTTIWESDDDPIHSAQKLQQKKSIITIISSRQIL